MNRFIDWIVNHRKWSLLGAGVLGLALATGVYIAAGYLCNKIFQSSITLLFLGLPTFFTLWVFRTHDVQEQLKKAEEQLKRTEENTNNNTFFECARLLTAEGQDRNQTEDSLLKKIALEQLAYLRRETSFDREKVDILIKNISLEKKHLNYAQLCSINLSGMNLTGIHLDKADLSNADLRDTCISGGANLKGTNLREANLSEANLSGTNLREANLSGANLKGTNLGTTDLNKTNLRKAIYNERTNFRETIFENDEDALVKAGMIYQPDGENPKK